MKRMKNRQEERTVKLVLLTAAINLVAALVKLIDSIIESLR